MTFEETQAAMDPYRVAGLAASGLLALEYRRFWGTRVHALGTVVLCQAGPREFIVGLFMGESIACHLATPELADAEAARASIERDVADPKFGREWAGEWLAVPQRDDPSFRFTQR